MKLTLQTAGELLKAKKAGSRFAVPTVEDRMVLLQAARAAGRVVKTKMQPDRTFKVWVIE